MAHYWAPIRKHLNFYRVHVTFFVFTPLLTSAIFYGLNGTAPVPYIDCLFLCISAITVAGLAPLDLSVLTSGQQLLLFLLMCVGNPVFISGVMVFIRRYYFSRRFRTILGTSTHRRGRRAHSTNDAIRANSPQPFIHGIQVLSPVMEDSREDQAESPQSTKSNAIDEKARVYPTLQTLEIPVLHSLPQRHRSFIRPSTGGSDRVNNARNGTSPHPRGRFRRISDPGSPTRPIWLSNSPKATFHSIVVNQKDHSGIPATKEGNKAAIFFEQRDRPRTAERHHVGSSQVQETDYHPEASRLVRRYSASSRASHGTARTRQSRRSLRGLDGFPMPAPGPHSNAFHRLFPTLHEQLSRTITIPEVITIAPQRGRPGRCDRRVSYISFNAVVDKNSQFRMLTRAQLEELAGVEYRALNALLWILAGYHVGLQLLGFAVMAPYMSTKRWSEIFVYPQLHADVAPAWFSLFHAVSSYTNTGLSLVDQSMMPFHSAYGLITPMIILILAGNTAFPIFLRFTIWSLWKMVPNTSRLYETLQFLLDHPRRCFIYLFPSHQTWFLLTVLVGIHSLDWLCFMLLNVGNMITESLPFRERLSVGLLQAITVRGGGFGWIPVSGLAPAIKILYVVMMYISVYPLAMSVRSTNVYEKQSLGIFREDDGYIDEDESWLQGPRVSVWGRYLKRHMRRQLAFDMWWLALALFFVCIIERKQLENLENLTWFSIFSIIFELVSAYGIIGLSLGLPMGNYSFSGSFHPLSKLVVCLVMLRGRHRGLPVAIDRAVMIPKDLDGEGEGDGEGDGEGEGEGEDEEEEAGDGAAAGAEPVYDTRITSSPQPQHQAQPQHHAQPQHQAQPSLQIPPAQPRAEDMA